MKLSAAQAKTFSRIQRRHKVSSAFLLRNMPAILKFVQYAITPHIVLKRKLIRRRNRVFLRHNHPRKLIFDPSQLKKRKRAKRIHSQWSKRLVMHLKRYYVPELEEAEKAEEPEKDEPIPPTTDAKLPEKVVAEQMKQQLELLNTGIRRTQCFPKIRKELRQESTDCTDSLTKDDIEDINYVKDIDDNKIEDDSHALENGLDTQLNLDEIVDDAGEQHTGSTKPPMRLSSENVDGNFIDALFSMVNSASDSKGNTPQCTTMNPPKKQSPTVTANRLVVNDDENSNSSSDFLGFDDNERISGSMHLDQKHNGNKTGEAIFISDFLDTYMRDNSLGNSTVVKTPVRRPNNGLVGNKSTPPKLDMPALPEELLGVRTVAERRTFFQKSKNVKFCLIKNVNTIYQELRRCIKGQRINKHSIETLLMSNSVPLTRDGWKAAAWLLTNEGNQYFQRIAIDGEHFNLYGCRGNSPRKFRRPHSSRVEISSPLCKDDCIDRIIFRALRPIRTLERRSKLGDAFMNTTYKACPLSQKIVQLAKDEEEPVYQNLKIMRMPQVELEVFPQLQKPLNDIAKRYLQLILPYDGISREWAEFSVSTLLERQKMEAVTSRAHSSFTFKLPYRNDSDSVLVRRMHDRSEKFDNSEFSFRKEVDEQSDDTLDLLAKDCADVLSDILNSVAISCSENSFIQNDPDNIYEYKNSEDDVIKSKSVKKPPELHQHQPGQQYKKQTKLMMELKRLNATIIDAASSKTEEDCTTCDKEICKLGCVCASLNEGTTVRQHCGKQRCVLDCNCKCPTVMRLETDGRTITTEDAFMLRRQATAKLARMEKEFTSTVVLTGSETLLINESQYEKKRRCTKVPKRYGDFVDPDEPNFNDNKKAKRIEPSKSVYIPREPILVTDKIYQRLNHCQVNIKRLRDVEDLAPWCMVHMLYRCHCKGQAIVGNPIVLEKQEDQSDEGTTIDESLGSHNTRSSYSFEKNDLSKTKQKSISSEIETYDSDTSDSGSLYKAYATKEPTQYQQKLQTRGRKPDIDCIGVYMNAQANHCRRVVPIPKNTYLRRNRKRVARIQLFIAENETDQTKFSLNEHVLRSVYYHKNNTNAVKGKISQPKNEFNLKTEETSPQTYANVKNRQTGQSTSADKRKTHEDSNERLAKRRCRMVSQSSIGEGESLLRVNHYKNAKIPEKSTSSVMDYPNSDRQNASTLETIQSSPPPPPPPEQIIVPKIFKVCSLNAEAAEMFTDNAPSVAVDIPQQMNESDACIENVDSNEIQNLFQIVIKNMNNLVSKKMQDIDLALRRESKAIPMPNEEILCIIRWRNFLEAFTDGFVYLWEVRTIDMTFLAATIQNMMPLVVNALSVVNIRALPKDGLPLLGKMLIDQVRNAVTDGLAVVMQGHKLYWFVKGFLRPDKARICPRPTPETHPLLTKKINVLCRLLMSQQVNDYKNRQENSMHPPLEPSNLSVTQSNVLLNQPCNSQSVVRQPMLQTPLQSVLPRNHPQNMPPKVRVLHMQRNISDEAKKILEQMLTQAYGLVRSNISFRKLRQFEIRELCNPASIRDDHQWLVLDIRNDFSHIFIPELGDLLTLDRVFKVMAFSVSKNRIVKMQFGPRSLFNVYVTPVSHRKLYFGPFRNSFVAPKLVLFQSVNGQMLLREVYESKHNVAAKTDKTCSFWLTQKRGNLFFDVEPGVLQTAITNSSKNDIHEIVDYDDVSSNASTALVDTVQENVVVVQNIPILDEKKSDQLSATTRPHTEDDDDCMIIEDEVIPQTLPINTPVGTTTPERINFTISCGGDNSPLVVVHNDGDIVHDKVQKTTQNSFTILSPEFVMSSESPAQQSQKLVLPLNPIENMEPQELPTVITIPKIGVVNPSIDIPAPAPSVTKVSVPAKHSKSSVAAISTLSPSVTKVQTLTPSITKMAIPAKVSEKILPQPTAVTTPAVEEATKESISAVPSSAQADEVQNSSDETEGHKTDANIKNITSAAKKWNRNVTITKLSVDSEGNETKTICLTSNPKQVTPSQPQKTVTVALTTSTGKVLIKNQPSIDAASMPANAPSQIRPIGTRQIVARPTAPNFYRNPNSPLANQMHAKPTIPQMRTVSSQQYKTNGIRKLIPVIPGGTAPGQRPTFHGGLSVRTPTAINTLVRTAQPQQLIRNLAPATTTSPLQHTNASSRMRVSTTLPASVNRTPGPAPNTLKYSPNAVFLKNSALSTNTKGAQQQPPQSRRIITSVNVEGPTQSKIRKLITGEGLSQTDPLEIPIESDTAVDQVLRHKLPNQTGSVKSNGQLCIGSPGTTADPIGSAVKRNSMGAVVNRQPARLITAKPIPPVTTVAATIVTSVSRSSTSKGIPIELPRLKKFAIIGSANTTVITPMTRPTGEKNANETQSNATQSDSAVAQKKKIVVATGVSKRPSIGTAVAASTNSSPTSGNITKTIMKVITPAGSSKPKTLNPNSTSQPIEYGYFFGNIEGLPKFVVKRSNDDYLIKVPNFNGILKLTGLSTVHNYLNQYIIQKCGKKTADLKNIKWSFKTQDRSKMVNINQLNSFNVKPANTNPKFQKVIPIKRTEPTADSSSTSTTATTVANNNAKSIASPAKKFNSVILVDDE